MRIAKLLHCFIAKTKKNNLTIEQPASRQGGFNNRKSHGFTLIELLVVIAVIGVLASATLIAVNPLRNINQAKEANLKSDMSQIVLALKAYLTTHEGKYPDVSTPPLQNLVVSGELDELPQQQDGTEYDYQKSAVCDSSGCEAVVWGKLYNAPTGTVWCWDSADHKFKQSPSAPGAGSTTCP